MAWYVQTRSLFADRVLVGEYCPGPPHTAGVKGMGGPGLEDRQGKFKEKSIPRIFLHSNFSDSTRKGELVPTQLTRYKFSNRLFTRVMSFPQMPSWCMIYRDCQLLTQQYTTLSVMAGCNGRLIFILEFIMVGCQNCCMREPIAPATLSFLCLTQTTHIKPRLIDRAMTRVGSDSFSLCIDTVGIWCAKFVE